MKQKFLIFGGLIFLMLLLIGLNAASYVQKEKLPDNEINPNRSTFNAGVTGMRAFYELLSETNRKVVRWQEPPDALLDNKNAPQTFVVAGNLKRDFTDAETAKLFQWVSEGGKLVVIERQPPDYLVPSNGDWRLKFNPEKEFLELEVDPSDAVQMTAKTDAAIPVQPSVYTNSVNSVQPSRLASSITFERLENTDSEGIGSAPPPAKDLPAATDEDEEYFTEEQLTPTPKPSPLNAPKVFAANSANENSGNSEARKNQTSPAPVAETMPLPGDAPSRRLREDEMIIAPVAHLSNKDKNLLVDIPYGAGKIVYLSDPFILSNGGLRLADNVQLGINIVASRDGTIAFDEYHQGFGANNNRFFEYFAGTPVVSIFIQVALLVGLLLLSQSRRFARPVPEKEPDRLSKLEYVSAMAELQQRTKAFDLALENIYNDFRRRVARLFGVDNHTTTRKQLAHLIAERTKFDPNEIEDVLFKCEEIIHGERTGKKEVVRLAQRLREFEEKLGLQRQKRRSKIA